MAAVSYLQNIDTRPVEYKPYKLPWQGFMQEFQAKNQYFAESAALVQQSYKNVLDIDPEFQQNKEYVKNFLSQAQKDLAKVVKSDMTVTDNAVNASNLFKPIFDTSKTENRLLLTDSELNKFYREQGRLANNARTTKNGEAYNKDNEFYFRSQEQKYRDAARKGENINTIDDHYANKKGYIPYYDVTPELEKITKLCHEDSSSTTKVGENYLYLDTKSVTGVTQSKMQGCLGLLSPQAKQQIGINSYSQYYNNRDGLLQSYKSLFVDKNKDKYDSAMAMQAAAKGYKGKDPKILAEIQQINSLVEQTKGEYNNGVKEWDQMIGATGEQNYIEKNYDRIASIVGNIAYTERAAKSLSWQEVENKVSPNASGLAQFRHLSQMNLNQQQFGFDQQLLQQRQQGDLLKLQLEARLKAEAEGLVPGGAIPSDSGILPVPPESSMQIAQEELTGAQSSMNQSVVGLNRAVLNYITQNPDAIDNNPNINEATKLEIKKFMANPNVANVNFNTLANFIDTYDKMGINDPMISASLNAFNKSKQKMLDLTYEKQAIEKSVGYKPESHNILLLNGGSATLNDDEVLTLENGGTVRGYNKSMFRPNAFQLKKDTAEYNKERYAVNLEKAYKERWTISNKWFYTPENEKQAKETDGELRRRFAIPEEYNITEFRTNSKGDAIFRLTKTIKEEGEQKQTVDLTEEEMKALNLPNVSYETFGGSGSNADNKRKNTYFRSNSLKPPMSSFIDPGLQRSLSAYVESQMPNDVGVWANPMYDKEVVSNTGKTWKIRVGNAPSDQPGGSTPIFQAMIKTPKGFVPNGLTYGSIEEVISVINSK